MKPIPSALKTAVKTGVTVAIFYVVFRSIDLQMLQSALRRCNPAWLLWSLIWFVFSKVIASFRFNELIKTEDIHLNPATQLKLYWLGMYYNLLLPGGISGDGYKIKLLMDHSGKPLKRLFAISLYDRLSGMLALGQLCLLLLFGLPALLPYVWAIALALVASVPVSKVLFNRMVGATSGLWARTNLQSLAVQGAQLIATLGIILAFQEGSNWLAYSLLFLISSVVAMLPLTIGGTGARELTFLWGAAFLQINAANAVAIAFLFYLISTAVALFGVAFSFNTTLLQKPSTT